MCQARALNKQFDDCDQGSAVSNQNGKGGVLIVDSHAMFCDGLGAFFEHHSPCFKPILTAPDVSSAKQWLQTNNIGVVLFNATINGENSLNGLTDCQSLSPSSRFLVMTDGIDPHICKEAIANGASGVIPKECGAKELLEAMNRIVQGETWINHKLSSRLLKIQLSPEQREIERLKQSITPREFRIIKCITEGMDNKTIGKTLGISDKSVRNSLTSIFDKVQVKNRLELLLFVLKHSFFPKSN